MQIIYDIFMLKFYVQMFCVLDLVLLTRGFFGYFYGLYSTLLHLPPLRFPCVGGGWDQTQDWCDFWHYLLVRRSNHSLSTLGCPVIFKIYHLWPDYLSSLRILRT
jgi:hypothetical protein